MELSLDPIERPQSTKESSLSEKIVRITQERGSFSDITEDSLREEISTGDGPPEEPQECPEEIQEFEQQRAQLSAKIRSALNESALSLDFVSLLVSSLRPQAGASSMSPMLKGQVPIGTLSGDTITAASVMPTLSETRGDPAYGWKLLALDDAVSKLETATTRLEQETDKEHKFWNETWSLMTQGEKIFKQKRSLRIKYGYRDSGSHYFNPGLGTVDRNEDGSLLFTPATQAPRNVVCVTVHRNDKVDGRAFALPTTDSEISVARHHLFEDELFYYLVQEARTLAGSRVSLAGSSIVCQLYECIIEISSVPVESLEPTQNEGILANVVCNCLHLLLNSRHAANLERQRSSPAPLNSSVKKGQPEDQPLLKPVLAHIQHSTTEQRVKKLLEMMLPGAKITQLGTSPAKSTLEVITECPPTVLKVSGETSGDPVVPPGLRITVNPPFEAVLFEAEMDAVRSQFCDLAEFELWLRAHTFKPE